MLSLSDCKNRKRNNHRIQPRKHIQMAGYNSITILSVSFCADNKIQILYKNRLTAIDFSSIITEIFKL